MPTAKFSGLALHLGRFAPDGHPAADGELLARFVATRDEPAFAELVRRYGRLVFAVCRRVTGSHHLAEDAFQAVFVVLAAKAASVRPAAALPAWLHAVATRTALRARTVADRRRRRETPVESLPDAAGREGAPAADADLAAVVDEEIARLPDALRAAVVLCESTASCTSPVIPAPWRVIVKCWCIAKATGWQPPGSWICFLRPAMSRPWPCSSAPIDPII